MPPPPVWQSPITIPRTKRIADALNEVGELGVRAGFKTCTFIYGTQGTGSAAVRAATLWRSKMQTLNRPDHTAAAAAKGQAHNPNIARGEARKRVFEAFKLFEPGTRVEQYVHKGYQMMDMYYGPSLSAHQEAAEHDGGAKLGLHALRHKDIAAFVHHAMGFKGPFVMGESGRKAYMDTFKTGIEGWAWNTPAMYQLPDGTSITATQEMSALIRWGIHKYGGTLIFEGKQVFYHQVFAVEPEKEGSRKAGDTELEAMDLFPYFQPGLSRVKYGTGTVIFQWGGKETVPTKCHFLSNWQGALKTVEATAAPAMPGKDIGHWVEGKYVPFAKPTVNINGEARGIHMHSPANVTKRNVKDESFSGAALRPIWNRFLDAPAMLHPETGKPYTADEVVALLFGSTAIGNRLLRKL
ncbi:MAG: hypothetical protein QOI41_3369 [Myxococcales bacterium]|jgi:hypothetical protein|nr:hypothetical protein [Myxococcales bacterium]